MKQNNFISWSIRHQRVVVAITLLSVAVGIVGIFRMNKDEFPSFQIKQGLVAAVYPGATAKEVEAQVTKPLEKMLFAFPEVSRSSTYSYSKNGICYIYVDLVVPQDQKDIVWAKIKHKLNTAKLSLPPGVLGVAVIDDFSSVAAMLVTIESDDKGPSELNLYAEDLAERLESIDALASVHINGSRTEEIAVNVDADKLALYGLSPSALMLNFQSSGLLTSSGTLSTDRLNTPLYINSNITSEGEIADHIVYTDPSGNVLRLKDIATIKRQYAKPSSVVTFNGRDAIVLSIEMRNGNNIVDFGNDVNRVLSEFKASLPPSVHVAKITDQPRVVDNSVMSFLRDLLISILVVIAVMLALFPLKSALIASSGVPVCTAVAIAAMYASGIELNTVTLAALIVTLGMIVDDSIITMDGYMANLPASPDPKSAAVKSGQELVLPMFMATAAICLMFFPMTHIISGYLGDFVRLFPWVITFALAASLAYAVFVVPSLEVRFIHHADNNCKPALTERVQHVFFNALQKGYEWLQERCFRLPKLTLAFGAFVVVLGLFLFSRLNIQMMPRAARNFFAVEVYLDDNSTLADTRLVTDSLEQLLLQDARVKSVTTFAGTSAPRFTATYAPMVPAPNFAQLIVNTKSVRATNQLLKEYQNHYSNLFPNAILKYKQMDYQATPTPLEVLVEGGSYDEMVPIADTICAFMRSMDDELQCVRSTSDGFVSSVCINMDPDEAARLGINRTMLSLYLSSSMNGQPITTLYEDNRKLPVVLYNENISDSITYDALSSALVPTTFPGVSVPLGSVASLSPQTDAEQFYRYAGTEAISVGADLKYGQSHPAAKRKLDRFVASLDIPDNIKVKPAGLASLNGKVIPEIVLSFIFAVAVLFVFLLIHFRKVSIAVLTLSLSTLCLFGAFFGLWLFNLDFGITSVLGLISLVGIIVRNGIIMFEYAEELRFKQNYDVRSAAIEAGKRRMRPIFLTSCTTALGVIPMIIAGDLLWMPMGVVICFGTMLSIVLVVIVMPISYWQLFKRADVARVKTADAPIPSDVNNE